ncbi:MAG TPA: 3'-5' exonuclease [Steroidobacteraceae bacterium]|nr:3'-5' exonuclease [Steroidobacteraceae bacterium]
MADPKLEALAAELERHADYRVLRRLEADRERPALVGEDIAHAVVLDTETTGMDPAKDRIVELALVKFEYLRSTGEVGRVLGRYDGLEDPGMPIPPEATAVHGITDEMVRGRRLAEEDIERLMEGVGVVIAHNAGFDRPFTERRLPEFAGLAWGCSLREVPWESEGLGSAKLDYLAYRHGFFYDAHRAQNDCHAVLELLRRPFGTTARSALHLLLQSAREPSARLWATGSPFESKDLLRARGYRWDGEQRCWYRDIPSAAAERDAECQWLREAVYGGRAAVVDLETFDARTRYSGRSGRRERLRL